jgi:hypothetical protein
MRLTAEKTEDRKAKATMTGAAEWELMEAAGRHPAMRVPMN